MRQKVKEYGDAVRQATGIDYQQYHPIGKEKTKILAQGCLIVIFLAWFFYRSVWAVLFLSPLLIFFWKQKQKELASRRRGQLAAQFRELLLGIEAALKGGYSLENAFMEAGREVAALFGQESPMAREMEALGKQIQNHIPLEEGLMDLAQRSGVQEIREFAEIFSIARYSGGNLEYILRRTAGMIAGKMDIKREIRSFIASKQYELRIMNLVPFFIVGYVSLTSSGYFSVLYHNIIGIVIMTVLLAVYVAAFLMGKKLVQSND